MLLVAGVFVARNADILGRKGIKEILDFKIAAAIIERRVTLCRWLLGVSVCVTAIASVLPLSGSVGTKVVFSVGLDKIFHFAAFATIAFLAVGALEKPTGMKILAASAGVWLFGAGIEAVQLLAPTRTFNPLDIAANSAGILAGAAVWLAVGGRAGKK